MKLRRLLSALIVASLIPFPTTTVPEWKLRYVDNSGNPVPNLLLSQTWQNYSIESSDNDMDGSTDWQGYVTFPEHKAWSPLVVRILHPVFNVLSTGVHASFGNTSWVIPKCDVKESGPVMAVYYGQPLPTEIVLVYEDHTALRAATPGSIQPPPSCSGVEAQVKGAG